MHLGSTTACRIMLLTACSCYLLGSATGFQSAALSLSRIPAPVPLTSFQVSQGTTWFSKRTEKDDVYETLLPETSFGSEAVPQDQRPINEYLNVMRQPLFDWAAKDSGSWGLLTRLTTVYVLLFAVICYPISGATFTQEGYLLQKLAASNVGALIVIFFLLVRLYSGWGYVGSRLTSKVIEYEETGWYDGDFQLKSDTEQKRDKFLYNSKVRPIVDRLKVFIVAVGGLCLASFLAFNVAMSANPIFDEYDPHILERLRYDDKLADRAASSSGGRPTYCDNRYYRAVAGGGQGCN